MDGIISLDWFRNPCYYSDMKLIHADDWKAKYERAEDRGNPLDLHDLIGDIQENAIKFALAKAKKNIGRVLDYNYASQP